MVESETFVSRRKNVSRRGRRKLFTARGLVDEINKTRMETEQSDIFTASETKSSTMDSKSNSTKAAPQKFKGTNHTASSLGLEPSLRNQTSRSSRLESSLGDATFNSAEKRDEIGSKRNKSGRTREGGKLVAYSAKDSMHKALEDMGCMDGMFSSGSKNKDNSMIKFSKGGDGTTALELNMKVPMPNLNFIDKLIPTENDVHSVDEHIHHRNSKQKGEQFSSLMRQTNSRLPYKTAEELAVTVNPPYESLMALSEGSSEDDIASAGTGNRFQDHNAYSQLRYQQEFQVGAMSPAAMGAPLMNTPFMGGPPMVPPPMSAPPMQIFIDEQPCLSDDLIPVDDMPPPAMNFDLTRYHPKPLNRRPQYDRGEALLSFDSEDSDTITDTVGENPVSQSPMTSDAPSKMKGSSCPSFDEAGPSFDEYNANEPASNYKKMSTTPKFSTLNERMSVYNAKANVSSSPRNRIQGNSSIASSECSVASDEAIATDEPMPVADRNRSIAKTVNSDGTENPRARQTYNMERLRISAESSETSTNPQDENNTPWKDRTTSFANEQNERTVRSSNRMSLSMAPAKTTSMVSSDPQTSKYDHTGRRPFDLMVSTNLPLSPKNEGFFSPKVSTPHRQSSVRSSTEFAKRRFAFEDSFDETEFFETNMA